MKKLSLYLGGVGTTLVVYFTAAQNVTMAGLTLACIGATVLTYYMVD